jgi:serine/threonine protein kinase
MPLSPGTRLGPYEVLSAIGAGGMGEVYKARDTRLDRAVALKVLPASFAADPAFKSRFERLVSDLRPSRVLQYLPFASGATSALVPVWLVHYRGNMCHGHSPIQGDGARASLSACGGAT